MSTLEESGPPAAPRLIVAGLAFLALFAVPALAQHGDMDMTPPPGAPETYPSLHIRGFTDFDYAASDAHDGRTSGFELGQFVLHLVSPLAGKVTFFGEVSATPKTNQFLFEVERAFIRYDYNDAFKVSAGRYHTPIGYWNTAYHHGFWLQTTIRRPEQVQIGGVYVPVHFIGLLVEGKVPSGPIGLGYAAGVGNGRSEILSRGGDTGDPNPNRAWIAQLVARPTQIFGFEAGSAVYRDEFAVGTGPTVAEWIYSGHVAWVRESPEVIGEWIGVQHENRATGATLDSRAFYVQGAYRLPGAAKPVKPYARYEKIDVADNDPVFTFPDLEVVTSGVRLDLSELAALKGEYRNEHSHGLPRVNALLLQVCFTF